MPLLILHERHTPDDSDIWRVAVRRKWTTERVNRFNVRDRVAGHSMIRYYGSLDHWALKVKEQVPQLHIPDLDPTVLPAVQCTHRSIRLMTVADLASCTREWPLFIKPTTYKWFEARVYLPDEPLAGEPLLNDLLYTQDIVEFVDEVRCFCVEGSILTSSLYRIGKVVYSDTALEPDQVRFDDQLSATPIPGYVAAIWKEHGGQLPHAYVADFGRHPDGTWSLIEFNEPWCSGLYYCDPERCFDCIMESQTDRPPGVATPLQ